MAHRAAVELDCSWHHRREEWGAQQDTPHFLQHDALLAEAETLTAIGFWDADRGQAKFGIDRSPAVAFVAIIGFHQSPHFVGRRTVRQEAAQVGPELFLLA